MHSRLIAIACSSSYMPGLRALLNSIFAYHRDELPVAVFHDLSPRELQEIASHPLEPELVKMADLVPLPAGSWEAKQCIPSWAVGRARCIYLLDADIVLTSRIDDVFEIAENGKIVSSLDGSEIDYGRDYAVYSPAIVGQRCPYVNSGALCLNVERHWEVAALWAFSSAYSSYSPGGGAPLRFPGHGDQGTLNAILAMLGKHPDVHALPEETWCDSTVGCRIEITRRGENGTLEVNNLNTGQPQRVVHSSGPKWWTAEGERHLKKLGDKLECFLHFANSYPTIRNTPASPPELPPPGVDNTGSPTNGVAPQKKCRVLVAICSCKKNTEKRGAARDTWLGHLPGDFESFFFVGGSVAGTDEPDVIGLDAPDNYASLPTKVQAAFRFALGNYDFDYLFKCDDDTYVVPERLRALADRNVDMVGSHDLQSQDFASGGAGYLVSRSCIEAMACADIPSSGAEDVAFSKVARRGNFSWDSDHRLQPGIGVRPSAGNTAITSHYCDPTTMRKIDRMFDNGDIRSCFVARHRHWEGLLQLNNDGTFIGGSSKPDGIWRFNGDQLVLDWAHGQTDILDRDCHRGFRSVDLSLSPTGPNWLDPA